MGQSITFSQRGVLYLLIVTKRFTRKYFYLILINASTVSCFLHRICKRINVHVYIVGFSSNNSTLTAGSGLSGTGTHKDYVTTGQYALVLFTTDSSGQAQGFTLQYLKASDLCEQAFTFNSSMYLNRG